jgi:hypothetical protein
MSESQRRGAPIGDEIARAQRKGMRVSWSSVRRYFGHDLERGAGGRTFAKKSDRSYHGDLRIVSTDGVVERPVRGSNARRLASEHANAVRRFLRGLDPEAEGLERFAGKRVGGVELETDPARLAEIERRGDFDDFLDLYADRGF